MKNVLAVSVTASGQGIAGRLPYRSLHGSLIETVAREWARVDGLVLCCATGIAVRAVAGLLADKGSDPAVVVVDDGGQYAIALTGGHLGGANALANEVAELLGARAVITTATDARGIPALDDLNGFVASGDIAGLTRRWLDGELPAVINDLAWPVPFAGGDGPAVVVVTDRKVAPSPGVVALHPPSLVVGVGASSDARPSAASELLDVALADAGLDPCAVGLVATIDRRAGDAVVTSLGHPVASFTAAELALAAVPNPSAVVAEAVGTPSVAEASALLGAGRGSKLVVTKRAGATATVAVARRNAPVGSVQLVGLGPGDPRHRTPAATTALRRAEVVIGYRLYVTQCRKVLGPAVEIVESPLGAEVQRCEEALRRAGAGQRVALVCSGDTGIFAMATVVLEIAPRFGSPPVEVIPGVTASVAAAAVLGAPLGHDHAQISLSDLLTPWPVIAARLHAAASSDLVIALYNPRSPRRTGQFEDAVEIIGEHRCAATPVGIVTNATRPDQVVAMTTLGGLDPQAVGMFSMVIVGSSSTRIVDGRMVTPRGYAT